MYLSSIARSCFDESESFLTTLLIGWWECQVVGFHIKHPWFRHDHEESNDGFRAARPARWIMFVQMPNWTTIRSPWISRPWNQLMTSMVNQAPTIICAIQFQLITWQVGTEYWKWNCNGRWTLSSPTDIRHGADGTDVATHAHAHVLIFTVDTSTAYFRWTTQWITSFSDFFHWKCTPLFSVIHWMHDFHRFSGKSPWKF